MKKKWRKLQWVIIFYLHFSLQSEYTLYAFSCSFTLDKKNANKTRIIRIKWQSSCEAGEIATENFSDFSFFRIFTSYFLFIHSLSSSPLSLWACLARWYCNFGVRSVINMFIRQTTANFSPISWCYQHKKHKK